MCPNQPGELGEAVAKGARGFCLEDRLALNKVNFSQNWEKNIVECVAEEGKVPESR